MKSNLVTKTSPRLSFAFAAVTLILLGLGSASAGPNASGTLVLHFDATPGTCEIDQCPPLNITVCEDAVTRVDGSEPCPTAMWVLAAFPDNSSPRLAGVTFGWTYDPASLGLIATFSCSDFELPTSAWPAPGEGTALVFDTPRTDPLVPLYWFIAYLYEGAAPSVLELAPHPLQGAFFADDSIPAEQDGIEGLGALGFEKDGWLPCPDGLGAPGACCFEDVSCQVLPEVTCGQSGGWHQGPFTDCDPNPCEDLVGACCSPAFGCRQLRFRDCDDDFLGIGVPCNPDPCPPVMGACCVDLVCFVYTPTECTNAGGGYLGNARPCDPDPCELLTGCPPGGLSESGDSPEIVSLGGGPSNPLDPPASRGDLEFLYNADGTYENGGSFRTGAQARPWFGAFAEGFEGDYELHSLVFDFSTDRIFDDANLMDVFVWADEDGCPGAVVCMESAVDVGTIAFWPDVSRHEVEIDPCCPGTKFWIGYWGDWPEMVNRWYCLFDQNAFSTGNPKLCAHPTFGNQSGWVEVDQFFSSNASGIGAMARPCEPVPVRRTSWGELKSLLGK